MDGLRLPQMRTEVPGPVSRALARRLRQVESPNVTQVGETGPIFWSAARGANVRDADGNTYVDLTAGFGVAGAGHAHPAVAAAVKEQVARLAHALGDVHPAEIKVRLLERLAQLAPGELSVSILSANGSDAVESAWKTAALASGRTGAVAFHGAYHGLGLGALALTSAPRFRDPFRGLINDGVRFAPFPGRPGGPSTAGAISEVESHIENARGGSGEIGAVFVEPVLGRGGIIVPPPDFLPSLRVLCDRMGVLLVLDEVYTGFGRTGRWFACEHTDVLPDILVVGKSLAGGLPLSAAIGTPEVMGAWPESEGEAIHTSTFLGNPVAAAAALAHIDVIEEEGLVEQAQRSGREIADWSRSLAGRLGVAGGRGLGLMQAVVLEGGESAAARAVAVSEAALRKGVILLPEGGALALTPPLSISAAQLGAALDVLEESLRETPG